MQSWEGQEERVPVTVMVPSSTAEQLASGRGFSIQLKDRSSKKTKAKEEAVPVGGGAGDEDPALVPPAGEDGPVWHPSAPLISAGFDGGNGELIDSSLKDGLLEARLNMGKEPFTHGTDKKAHHQWFYFKAANLAGVDKCRFRLINAGESSYPAAWPGTW
jgi:hypothetical protein